MKRLQKQIENVNNTMLEKGVQASQKESLFHWEVKIKGPAQSAFEGYTLRLNINFPQQFPFKFPHYKFKDNIYHPNVKNGEICAEMLGQTEWLPNKKVAETLEVILSMLSMPDISSAINLDAAQDYKNGKYNEKVKEVCQKNLQDQK